MHRTLIMITVVQPNVKRLRKEVYQVYTLADPRDKKIRYVGMSRNILTRFVLHVGYEKKNPQKYAWIQELLQANLLPEIDIVEAFDNYQDARRKETALIQHYLDLGASLLNRQMININNISVGTRPELKHQVVIQPPQVEEPTKEIVLPNLYTLKEVSRILRMSEYTIKKYIKRGDLEGVRVGDRWKVREEALERYIESRSTQVNY